MAATGGPRRILAESYGNRREAPPSPVVGTKNWELLNHGSQRFSPRHSHASCVFRCPPVARPNTTARDDASREEDSLSTPPCLWIAGGYSETHRSFDLEFENRNADVWYSRDGASWTQVVELYGDFLAGVGNGDAKVGERTAPWYGRFGHSLNALDGDGDSITDAIVLAGGFSPLPSNDVWITTDGIVWNFDGYAPWPGRAYHGSAVFGGNLWIMGGSPLSNDVWMGRLVRDSSRDAGYKVAWTSKVLPHVAPWAPRAGLCAVSQLVRNSANSSSPSSESDSAEASYSERMFILGGFAGFSKGHPQHEDGARTRNDVWVTSDGIAWDRVLPPAGRNTMPWVGRGFHGCTTWHSPDDRSRWVTSETATMLDSSKDGPPGGDDNSSRPRIFLTGGGYIGKKGSNEVRSLEAYVDTWWSHDGSKWARVNYEEGSKHKNNLFSTNEWTQVSGIAEDIMPLYLGKWGHTLESFYTREDLDKDGDIMNNANVSVNVCVGGASSGPETNACREMLAREDRIPALFVIGGKSESGPMVNDVFVSKPGVLCELNGVTCGQRGECGPGALGCICYSGSKNCNFDIDRPSGEEPSTGWRQRQSNHLSLIILTVLLANYFCCKKFCL